MTWVSDSDVGGEAAQNRHSGEGAEVAPSAPPTSVILTLVPLSRDRANALETRQQKAAA